MVEKRIHHTIIKCLEFGLSKKNATRLIDASFPLFDLLEREKQLLKSISIYPIKMKDENFTSTDIRRSQLILLKTFNQKLIILPWMI